MAVATTDECKWFGHLAAAIYLTAFRMMAAGNRPGPIPKAAQLEQRLDGQLLSQSPPCFLAVLLFGNAFMHLNMAPTVRPDIQNADCHLSGNCNRSRWALSRCSFIDAHLSFGNISGLARTRHSSVPLGASLRLNGL